MAGITAASSGRDLENGDLFALQGRMKKDPDGYERELLLQLRHFDACMSVLLLQTPHSQLSAASSHRDTGAAKDVADVANFLAHLASSYPQHLSQLPQKIVHVLDSHGARLQPALRRQLTQALILLRNGKLVELVEILPMLMKLQCFGDRSLRKLSFLHIVHDIRRMNLKHKNEATNRALQNFLYSMLQDENELEAKRALVVLAELHRRKVWTDGRTVNAICNACFHKSSRIMIAAMRFLLGHDQENEENDSDESDSDSDEAGSKPSVSVNREAMYKAYHKGTTSSRKKKQNKLQRVMRSMKKQQRMQCRNIDQGSQAPLQHVNDPQSFAEKLFTRLRTCNERFEVKLMMMMVISRAVGIHRLLLLNFYPYLQRYIQPHQRDVTHLLAAAIQSCHDLVPPDAVETMVRQLVNQFVHDRARPEVMAVGLNTVREMCMRIPLIMTRELLQDLALYKKSREKAVAAAARSIISVYRQLWPSLLEKKDRGRNADLSARPNAFGETSVATGVPGAELLIQSENVENGNNFEKEHSKHGGENQELVSKEQPYADGEEIDSGTDMEDEDTDDSEEGESGEETEGDDPTTVEEVDSDLEHQQDAKESLERFGKRKRSQDEGQGDEDDLTNSTEMAHKRTKVVEDCVSPIEISTQQSLRNLKKLVTVKTSDLPTNSGIRNEDEDGIFSNEDFARIRKLQAEKLAKDALSEHGISKAGQKRNDVAVKLSNSDNLNEQRVNPSHLEANIRKRQEKEERIASAKAGREDRLPYGARTAVKQKKTGGLSNRQKEKMKVLPLAARRVKAAKSHEKKMTKGRGKSIQFRGKKAWKQ